MLGEPSWVSPQQPHLSADIAAMAWLVVDQAGTLRQHIKGSALVVVVGTKVKNIRLTDGDHDIDCIGAMGLKSEFVKKV